MLDGYEPLGLMDRGRHIARTLRRFLPDDYRDALDILTGSVGERPRGTPGDGGMASFLYLPHLCFIAEFGLDDFEASMAAMYLLTQRFTAEFAIRPFLEQYEKETLDRLHVWAVDPSAHVRRLVSEGTRPRLPWARRLLRFQEDPRPVIALLKRLKDDPDPMVRRSVANNLNDVGKDHPEALLEVASQWLEDATDERRSLIRHALRSLVKRGDLDALGILGYGTKASVTFENVRVHPDRLAKGGKVTVAFDVLSAGRESQLVLLDLRIHFVKAKGTTSPKVFKLKSTELPRDGKVSCRKTVSLEDLTTRRHYEGHHRVEVLVNGRARHLGSFELIDQG